jgi:hypothetical protein
MNSPSTFPDQEPQPPKKLNGYHLFEPTYIGHGLWRVRAAWSDNPKKAPPWNIVKLTPLFSGQPEWYFFGTIYKTRSNSKYRGLWKAEIWGSAEMINLPLVRVILKSEAEAVDFMDKFIKEYG